MDRSITRRNFWGGFWGGVLGILATAKLGILALMGGCLVGVMLGFYYQELGQLAVTSWKAAQLKLQGHPPHRSFAEEWASWHPFDRAESIKAWAMGLAALLLLCIEASFIHRHSDAGLLAASVFALMCVFLSAIGGSILRLEPGANEARWEPKHVRYYFKVLQTYGHMGGVAFFAREFALAFLSLLVVPVGIALALGAIFAFVAFFIFMWPIALGLVCVPFLGLFVFSFMRGTYHLAMKPDHWSCLTVTITTTGIIAWAGQAYLEGVVLAVIALIAGLLSGFGAVQIHPVLHRWFEHRPRLARFFGRKLGQHGATLLEILRALVSPRRYQLKVRDILVQAVR